MDNGKCLLKRRTRLARKTLDPLYQQQLQFEENPEGKVLQVIIYVLILQDARQLDSTGLQDPGIRACSPSFVAPASTQRG